MRHARPQPVPRAALFNTQYLAYSATFIYEELRHHTRYEVEVFTARELNRELFPYEPVHVGGPWYAITRRNREFERLFRTREFDVVHGHFGLGGVYGMRYALRYQKPLVVTFHGYDVPLLKYRDRRGPTDLRYYVLGPRMLRRMTLGLCASQDLMDMLVDMGVPKERLTVHRLGIDLEAFAPGPRDPEQAQVVMVGRFVEKKGFEYGIRGFAAACEDAPAHLTIVGSGPLESRLRAVVDELGLGERVTFAGVLPSDEVARRLAGADVLLAPSVVASHGDRESGLIVAKEASASQVPVVGTLHGGIPEIIDDGVTGYLVPERDAGALGDRLGRLLRDPGLRTQMGQQARAKMEREYDNRERVAALEDLYDEAIARHRSSVGS